MSSSVPELSSMLCEGCGYILTGIPPESRCPECAKPVVESLPINRHSPLWEQLDSPLSPVQRFTKTTAELIFQPTRFFRLSLTRPERDRSLSFSRIHWLIACFFFGIAAAGQFQWLWDPYFILRIFRGELRTPILLRDLSQLILLILGFWIFAYAALSIITALAARLTHWEASYRGLRLPLAVVRRSLNYHAAHYLPVALIAAGTVVGYQTLLVLHTLNELSGTKYLYLLSAEVILAAAYLFKTYWTAMRQTMYANA